MANVVNITYYHVTADDVRHNLSATSFAASEIDTVTFQSTNNAAKPGAGRVTIRFKRPLVAFGQKTISHTIQGGSYVVYRELVLAQALADDPTTTCRTDNIDIKVDTVSFKMK